ncbi:MAG: hypothetical protein ACJA2D_001290 [Pseudohongiellaceae bacterium]|jgi:hypothetical protein
MNFKRSKLSSIAAAVTLGIAAMSVQAADQPILPTAGASAGAVFTGGATINGGASYLSAVPATEAADLVATIKPAAADVGKMGGLVVVAEIPGLGLFNLLSGGIWVPLTDVANVQTFVSKVLSASEEITIIDDLVGVDTNLAGMTISAFVGYYTGGDLTTLTFSSAPAALAISPVVTAGCPANTTDSGLTFKDKPTCILSGRITSDTHLTSNNTYLLEGQVVIGENVVAGEKTQLTIDAGTFIFNTGGVHLLVVDRNGQIQANGSAAKPIIFTYEGDETATEDTRGQWGGLVINGSATINEAGGVADGEGASGLYGGTNDTDNSGSMTYVQVKYAGRVFTESDELNGIAFQGVGSGTNIDYVQVHNNSDDGVEFFGGTVNAKHLFLTGNEDDSIDWTQGWTGKVQFAAVRMGSSSDHCIEADNNGDNNDATPRSNPTIANLTCSGGFNDDGQGVRLREGTSATITNSVIAGFSSYCVDIDQDATFNNAGGSIAGLNGNLVMRNTRVSAGCAFSASSGDIFSVADWYAAQIGSGSGTDLGGTLGLTNGNALNAVAVDSTLSDPFFDQVDYIGAIKDSTSDWSAGWTFKTFVQ